MNHLKDIAYKAKHYLLYCISTVGAIVSGDRFRSRRFLRTLKGKYKGRRCFVIGNGPSLTARDLELLKNEVTFASNRIYHIFEQTDWRPTYYAVFDDSIAADPDTVRHANKFDCKGKFFREQTWITGRKYKDACFLHSRFERKHLNNPQFSSDLSKEIYTIATVTYSLIQIARYLGFDEIVLLGTDHKYAKEVTKEGKIIENKDIRSYFGNQKAYEHKTVGASWEMDIAYQYAEKYSRENGFRIYNATRGGYLEIFERIDLDLYVQEDGKQ